MRFFNSARAIVCALALLFLFAPPSLAEEPVNDAAVAAVTKADVDEAKLAGHNAWMLTCTALPVEPPRRKSGTWNAKASTPGVCSARVASPNNAR